MRNRLALYIPLRPYLTARWLPGLLRFDKTICQTEVAHTEKLAAASR